LLFALFRLTNISNNGQAWMPGACLTVDGRLRPVLTSIGLKHQTQRPWSNNVRDKVATKEISIRIGQDEIGRIFNLKEHLDHNEVALSHASRYRRLGWIVEAIDAASGAPLDLDLTQPHEEWSRRLTDLSMERVEVNLKVHTGSASRLLVLEVNRGEGALLLDELGDWQAECVAAIGDQREQHYYILPPEASVPPSYFQAPQVLIFGEGGMVLAPPSSEGRDQESWRWLQPPWEKPLGYPKPAVWKFLKDHLPDTGEPDVPSWQEIYRTVSSHGVILKALLFPAASPETYYQGIVKAALNQGLNDTRMLHGLVWHAPHGDARQNPERWEYLQQLLAQALEEKRQSLLPAVGREAAFGSEAVLAEVTSQLTKGSLGRSGYRAEGGNGGSKFDQSVKGQFFQLLAGLGEKVISESCRYEAMLSGLGKGNRDVQSMVSEWEQAIGSPVTSPEQDPLLAQGGDPAPIEFEWAQAINLQNQKKLQWSEVQVATNEFLQSHPDLAANRNSIQIVLFCLKNYVSINPESARWSFREKLEKAGAMAREFQVEQVTEREY
jgi:hypothetical protein